MKPIKLTMQGFGSYGEKTTIDFTRPNQNLFLITGDTGAGKTTIFDAIVYALYGQNSSETNKKSGLSFLSQFSNRKTPTFVEFTFSECQAGEEQVYSVLRIPKINKKQGTITKTEIQLTLPDGTDFPGTPTETQARLLEILGLAKEQFMQVGMIAQGEFMQMLRSDTNTRKAIFRKLFGTELFERIIAELKKRNDATQSEMTTLLQNCQNRIADLHLPEDLSADNPLPSLKTRLANRKEKPNIVDLEELSRELKKLVAEQKKQLQEVTAARQATAARRDEINARTAKAQELAKAYNQLDQVLAQEKECASQEAEQNKNLHLSQGIAAAYEIKASYDRLADKEKHIKDTETQKTGQEAQLPELQKLTAAAQAAERAAQAKDQAALSACTATTTKVEAALQYFAVAEAARNELATAQNELAAAQENHLKAKEAQTAYAAQTSTWQEQIQELAKVKEELAQYRSRQEKTVSWDKKRTDLLALKRKVATASQKAAKAQENYLARQKAYKTEQDLYINAQQHFLDAQAGILAQELTPGQPCPVCGSTEHPHPHLMSAREKPLERQELEAMQKNVQQLEKAQTEAAALSQEAITSHKGLQEQFENQQEELFRDLQDNAHLEIPPENPLPFIQTALQKWQQHIEAKLLEYASRERELETIQKNLAQSGEKNKELQKNCDEASLHLQKIQGKVQTLQGKIKTLQEQQEYPDSKTAKAELAKAELAGKKARQELDKARKDSQQAMANLHKAETIIKECTTRLPALLDERDKLQQDYESLCKAKELSPAAWQSLVNGFPKEKSAELQAAWQKYNEDIKALQGRKASLLTTIGQQPRPVLDELASLQQETNALWQQQDIRQQQLRDMLLPNESILRYLEESLAARTGKLSAATVLDSLYNRMSGKISGKYLDIETFVQRYYLAAILTAANIRFREMSAGQFELRMMPMDSAEKGKHKASLGLNLLVYSTVTGQERDINTLSGGESFMAALSLALGLSDQIQANTSAINLDILFIDEGFGSLDDHSRGQAIRVLKRLSGSDKLIGIISHVTELKQEMDNQLIVTKDEHGSHVQWQIS